MGRKKTWDPLFVGDACLIPLTSGKGAYSWIDAEDYLLVRDYSWRDAGGYVEHSVRGKKPIMLSRLIMGITDRWVFVDHVNHDTLDNRKQNLRLATNAQNGWNRIKKVKGYSKQNGGYLATLQADKKIHRRWVKTEEEAIQLREDWEIKYHGRFRPT